MSEILDNVLEENQTNLRNNRIGFGRRLGAYLIDILIITIIGSIVGVLIGDKLVVLFFSEQMNTFEGVSGQLGDEFTEMIGKVLKITSGVSITGVILFVMEGALGQSFGKMILKIINTNVDGSAASPAKLWLRSLLKYGSSMLSLVGSAVGLMFLSPIASLWSVAIFIGFFFVLGDNKQGLHDIIAKTVVSRK